MTVAFPLTGLIEALHVRRVRFRRGHGQEFSGQGSGQLRAKDLRPSLWQAELTTDDLRAGEYLQIEARLDSLDGSIWSFYAHNPLAPYPQSDPGGSILGAATPTIHTLAGDNKRLRLTGLPNGYVLTLGDFLAFDYGAAPSRALHRIVEGGTTAVGGLTPFLEVRPHIRPGAVIGAEVTLVKPAAEMKLVPNSESGEFAARQGGGLRFSAIQVI